jgi:hypothetical protein
LDALELLLSADLPLFRTRIVGGASAEAASVQQSLYQSGACSEALQAGRIEVWPAIDRAALPELYSRSTVICVPSLREQFGMVAVEAMMCGTPVVASRIGGLQDLVVNNLTGYLVDRLNPPAMAAALAQFIRNPNLGKWMGRNARLWCAGRFELDIVTRQYTELYEVLIDPAKPVSDELGGAELLRQRMLEANQLNIERMTGSGILGWRDVSSSPIPSFVVETGDGNYFVKIHQERPRSLTCLIANKYNAQPHPAQSDRIKIARLVSPAPVAPKVISADEDSGVLIQEYLTEDLSGTEQEAETLMIDASRQIGSLVKVQGPEAERFTQALRYAAAATDEERALELVDDAAADLNTAILGVKSYLRQCHPQMELIRLATYLRKNAWAVRPEFGVRTQSLIRFLISEHSLIHAVPYFQHGSMKREHLMRRPDGTAAVCDLDHAGLYVGPHDIAHWFHDRHAHDRSPSTLRMLSQIYHLADTDEDRFLGAVWLAIFPIFRAIWRFAGGDWETKQWDMQFLTSYPEAFQKVFIRSKENAVSH